MTCGQFQKQFILNPDINFLCCMECFRPSKWAFNPPSNHPLHPGRPSKNRISATYIFKPLFALDFARHRSFYENWESYYGTRPARSGLAYSYGCTARFSGLWGIFPHSFAADRKSKAIWIEFTNSKEQFWRKIESKALWFIFTIQNEYDILLLITQDNPKKWKAKVRLFSGTKEVL